MNTAGEIAKFFSKQDPDREFLWQAFDREDIEAGYGELQDSVWKMVLRLYDKEPATFEDFQIDTLIQVANERLGN